MLTLIFYCAGEGKKEIFMPCYQGIKRRGFFCLDTVGTGETLPERKYQIEYKSKNSIINRGKVKTLKGRRQKSYRLFSWKVLNRVTRAYSFKPTFGGTFIAQHHKRLIYNDYI